MEIQSCLGFHQETYSSHLLNHSSREQIKEGKPSLNRGYKDNRTPKRIEIRIVYLIKVLNTSAYLLKKISNSSLRSFKHVWLFDLLGYQINISPASVKPEEIILLLS